MDELLDYEGVANLLGVSTRTIRRYVGDGKLPVIRLSQRTIRFSKTKVLECLNKEGK